MVNQIHHAVGIEINRISISTGNDNVARWGQRHVGYCIFTVAAEPFGPNKASRRIQLHHETVPAIIRFDTVRHTVRS